MSETTTEANRLLVERLSISFAIFLAVAAPFVYQLIQPGVPYFRDPLMVAAHAGSLIALASFFLARYGHVTEAQIGFASSFMALTIFVTISTASGTYSTWMSYNLVVPILVAGFLLRSLHVALVAIPCVSTPYVLGLMGILPTDTAVTAGNLALATAIVMILSAQARYEQGKQIARDTSLLADQAMELETVLNTTPDAIMALDKDDVLTVHNDAAADLLNGLGIKRHPNMHALQLMPDDWQRPLHVACQTAHKGGSAGPTELKWKDAWFEFTVEPMNDGGVLLMGRDITARIEAQEAEKRRTQQQATIARLQEMNRIKTQLLLTGAQRLASPLEPMQSSIDQLRADPNSGMLDALHGQTQSLAQLVSDLSDVAMIEAGQLQIKPEPVELSALVTSEVATHQANASERGIRLDATEDATVWAMGDARRLERLLQALLSNATRHAAGQVSVSCLRRGDEAIVRVMDDGEGFPEGAPIWDSFVHLNPEGGAGLGLYLAKAITEAHGGHIVASSEPGHTEFLVRLPLA